MELCRAALSFSPGADYRCSIQSLKLIEIKDAYFPRKRITGYLRLDGINMNLTQLDKQLPSFRSLTDSLDKLIEGRLWVKVLIGLAVGILVGILLGPDLALVSKETSSVIVNWLALPGKLFIALVQMIVVPLIFASIIRGLTSTSDVQVLKLMGLRSGLFFLATTLIASFIGLSIAGIVSPGDYVDREAVKVSLMAETAPVAATAVQLPRLGELPQTLLGLLPANPMQSMVSGEMLQVIIFAMIIGVALLNIGTDKSAPIFNLIVAIQEICMKVVSWAMLLAPYAVFGLISRLTAMVGIDILAGMFVYMLTVIAGLILVVVCYLIFIKIIAGLAPRQFLVDTKELLLLAFSTSSSAAVMPLSLETAEKKLDVPPHVAKFVIPLGGYREHDRDSALPRCRRGISFSGVFHSIRFAEFATSCIYECCRCGGIPCYSRSRDRNSGNDPGICRDTFNRCGFVIGSCRILDMARTMVNVVGDISACLLLKKNKRVAELPTTQIKYS